MFGSTSFKGALVLAAGTIALASAGCPVLAGNEALKQRSATNEGHQNLEKRFHQGSSFGECPKKRFSKYAGGGSRSWDWWPCELRLDVLRQNGKESNPLGADFIYAQEFAKLNCELCCTGTAGLDAEHFSQRIEEGHHEITN